MKRYSTIAAVAFLLVAFVLSGAVRLYQYNTSKAEVYGDAVERAVGPLRLERQTMEEELAELEKKLERQTLGNGVGVLLFLEQPGELMTQAVPILRKEKLPAMLGLSDDQFPGAPGCITPEQFRALRREGWGLCLCWDGQTPLGDYCARMGARLAELGESLPTVMRIAPESFRANLREELERLGFSILVVHGEEESTLVNRTDDAPLWELNAIPWNRIGIKSCVDQAVDEGGAFVMEMDFQKGERGFDGEIFGFMCEFFAQEEHWSVLEATAARTLRKSLKPEEGLAAKVEWYRNEIAQINREIDAIYQNN